MAFSTRRMASKAILAEETPYLRAAQQWDHRIGDARAQARNWRLMAFSSIAIAGIFAVAGIVGLVWAPVLFYVAVGFALVAALLNAVFDFCLVGRSPQLVRNSEPSDIQ